MNHDFIEQRGPLLAVLTAVAVSIGGLAELVPLMASPQTGTPEPGVRPYTALQLEGRDIYIREGCSNCHSQMIRPFRAETERYGPYSRIGESVYDHPFLFGSKRTGPDLARVGGRYSDEWHRLHLIKPQQLVPASNMPPYPWLAENAVDASKTPTKMNGLRMVGVPYSDDDIAQASAAVEGKTEMDAMIAYLQMLGTAVKRNP